MKAKGFTLIELLLVVAIIVLIGGVSVPVYQSFQVKNDVADAINQVSQSFSRAQFISQSSDGDSTWGVAIQSGSIVLFKGATFATRDNTYDETFPMSTAITPSGLTEVVFSKVFGLPQSTGTLTLTSSTNEIKTVVINSKGMIEY